MWRLNYTIMINLPRLPKILEKMHRMADQPEKYSDQEMYDSVRYVTGMMEKTGHIKTICYGAENLLAEGGYILYANHQGKYDAYSIVSTHEKPLTVMMDRDKSYTMLVSEIIDVLSGKRMDVNDTRHALKIIMQIAKEVAEGRRYIIFPEGIYSDKKHNTLWDFKPGCFKAATKAGVPIIPVALVDTYKVYNSWQITPVKTQVHYLKPLYPEEYRDMNTAEISAIVKERIQNKLTELGF